MKQISLGEFARLFIFNEELVKNPLAKLLESWNLAKNDPIVEALFDQETKTRDFSEIAQLKQKIIWRLNELGK